MSVKLDAVNELLEAVGEAPVTALDTGAVSVAGLAEATLDRESKRIQERGWHENTEYDVESAEPTDVTKVAVALSSVAWTYATKTLAKTAGFTSYTWAYGDQIYISGGTGVTAGWYKIQSKSSANAIILEDDIATANAADVTTTVIGYDDAIAIGSDALRVDTCEANEDDDAVVRNGYLYDRDDDTFTWGDTVKLATVRLLDWDELSAPLRRFIIAKAALIFHRRWIGDMKQEAFLREEFLRAQAAAYRFDADNADLNILDSEQGQQITGVAGVTHPGH